MIVTIDGPAGAGKSSAARQLAKRLGFRFLDTGAMYRAVTLAGMRAGIEWSDTGALARIAARLGIELTDDQVLVNGEDVTRQIRAFEVAQNTRHAADNLAVRKRMVELQRAMADGYDVVTEGRDQATVVFPNADFKIFLTAGDDIRARRRYADLISRGEEVTLAEVAAKQLERDKRDVEREFGGLQKAPDSIEVATDDLSPDEVVDRLEQIVRSRRAES